MSKGGSALVLLIFATLNASCESTQDDVGEDRAVLRFQLQEIEKLVSTGESLDFPRRYVRYFADDATLVTAPGAVIHGRENILAFYERVASNLKSIEWQTGEPTILFDGSLAVVWYMGVTRAVYKGQDTVSTTETRYVDLLRKQEDGTWKIMMHAWTRD